MIHHEHLVRLADRAEAVRDDETSPPAHEAGEGRLQPGLRQRVDRARRLVQDQDARVGEQRAGEGHQLLLPERESAALFRYRGMNPLRQGLNQVEAVEVAERLADRLVRCFRAGGLHVVGDRAGEEEVLLEDEAHLATQGLLPEVREVVPVYEHLSAVRSLELGQQADDGGLARAGMADQRDDLAGLGGEVHGMEHGSAGQVGERHVAELHRPAERRAGNGVRPVGPRRRRVQQAEVAFGPGHGQGGLRQLRPDDGDGGEEEVRQEEEGDEVAQAGVAAVEGEPAADPDERREETLGVEFEQRQVKRAEAGGLDDVAGEGMDQAGEDPGVGLLARKPLGHPDALHRLGQRRGDAGETFLLQAGCLQNLAAEGRVHEQEARDDGQQDEEQTRVHPEH